MKILTASLLAALAAVVPQAAAKPGHEQPLMAVVARGHSQVLTALDPLTLAPLGRGKVVGRESASILARSPAGGRVAVLRDRRWLAVFDLVGGRVTRWIDVGESVVAGLWTRPRRLVLLDAGGGVFAVTVGRRTALRWHPLDGDVVRWTAGGSRLVALVTPRGAVGPARLVVTDGTGSVRAVALPGIAAGQGAPAGADHAREVAVPGLAVDPAGRRVAVVPRSGPPTVVDLETLSLAGRSLAVARKQVSGYVRTATWFAPGLIAVSGSDGSGAERWTPAGLTLIDLTTGASRMVEGGVSQTIAAAPTLLACGAGLSGYAPTGTRLFHALGTAQLESVTAVGGLAYASTDGRAFTLLDTLTGHVVANATTATSTTIVGSW